MEREVLYLCGPLEGVSMLLPGSQTIFTSSKEAGRRRTHIIQIRVSKCRSTMLLACGRPWGREALCREIRAQPLRAP